jgi:leucyl/phenylalanyl-tRNA--protein transferase
MPIYQLNETIGFPDPSEANEEGLLAIGGDLSAERIITAYSLGIFPWFNDDSSILWWSPNPRLILEPKKFKLSKSLKRIIRKNKYRVVFDEQFEQVIKNCAQIIRKDEEGTWITNNMESAYIDLFEKGLAHSVEVYEDKKMIGGLYGVSLGKAFFGESMFFKKNDASKVALYYLCRELEKWGFHFIDAQVETDHLLSLGAEKIDRDDFLDRLQTAQESPTCMGKWTKNLII